MNHWKWDIGQKDFVADTLMDTAKNVMLLLVFGQILQASIHLTELIFGIVFYFWAFHVSLRLKKGVKPHAD